MPATVCVPAARPLLVAFLPNVGVDVLLNHRPDLFKPVVLQDFLDLLEDDRVAVLDARAKARKGGDKVAQREEVVEL